ncbi:MAG: hydroxyacid dehydrogenase [Sphingobacteriales bacterium]|nr:MAG: hydroxyacid dehydrogenase [Sphingobacteriales bacterium]
MPITQSGKVLIAAPVHPVLTDGLNAAGYQCIFQEKTTQVAAFDLIGDCTGVITSTRLQLDKELLDAAPQLQWIGRMGSGMEVIDVPYAASKNIRCYSSPEGNCNAVAEHALGLLLSVTKKIATSYNEVKDNKWLRDENRGGELEGKTIAVIGFGHTGSAFAKKLQGFDMRILAYDVDPAVSVPSYAEKCDSMEPIYREADIVSFHVPLRPDTLHYFNEAFLDNMERAFILVNTSRGKVVSSSTLLQGLQSGKISGAALDVWEEEPLEQMNNKLKEILNRCLGYPQFIVTPHIAGYSYEALYKMSSVLLNKIVTLK